MASINLLPWREELRERKNKEFLTLLVFSLVLGLAVAFSVWGYFNSVLSAQLLVNEQIIEENQKLDTTLTKIDTLEQRREEIISRMQVIQDLQGKRPLPVRVWYDVANALPKTMYLTEFKREKDILTFLGKADNPNSVSSLVRNLDASDLLDNSKVVYIKKNVTAYETSLDKVTSDENNVDRVPYPEDDYIEFVVTSDILIVAQEDQTGGFNASQTQPQDQ